MILLTNCRKRKKETTPFGINQMRSQVYWAACKMYPLGMYTTCTCIVGVYTLGTTSYIACVSIGGSFAVNARLGDSIIPGRIMESLQGPRAVTAHLLLQQAGRWTTAVSFHSSSPEGADVSTVIASHVVEVEEGVASASSCRLLGFWPVQGAIADVPAGFIIQVCSSYTGYIEKYHQEDVLKSMMLGGTAGGK